MNRRSFARAAAAAGLVVSAPAIARAQSSKLLLGYWPIAAALPFFVAYHDGYFKDAGADVELVRFADQVKVTEALFAGRIDATATGTGSTQLALIEARQPGYFKILSANLSSTKSILDEFIGTKGAGYKSVSDLKGKRIATGVGPQAMLEATLILQKAGVDVTPMEMSPAQHIPAIVSGQIDAAYTYEPNGTVGRLEGQIDVIEVGVRSKYLLGNPDAPWYGGAAVITVDFIGKNPSLTKAFIAGMRRGIMETRTSVVQAKAVYPDFTPYDVKLSEAIPPIQYTMYDEFTPSQIGYFQKNFDLFYEHKILPAKLNAGAMIYRA